MPKKINQQKQESVLGPAIFVSTLILIVGFFWWFVQA